MTEQIEVLAAQDISDELPTDQMIPLDWQGRQIDWLLQWFVKFVNDTSTEISITLFVGGSQISGLLVSHESYFKQIAEDFSVPFKQFDGVDPEQVKNLIHAFIPSEKAKSEREYHYLHLKDAKVFTGNGNPISSAGTLWRGKVAAVDGFNLGALTVN